MVEEQVREAITLCFDNWTAMKLAIDHGWGEETDRENLINSLTDTIVNYVVEEPDIQDILDEFMEDKFSVVLEDESSVEIARILICVYMQAKEGNSKELDRIRSLHKPRIEECKRINEIQHVTYMMQNTQMQEDIEPPQLVDEDGFEVVQSRRKKK